MSHRVLATGGIRRQGEDRGKPFLRRTFAPVDVSFLPAHNFPPVPHFYSHLPFEPLGRGGWPGEGGSGTTFGHWHLQQQWLSGSGNHRNPAKSDLQTCEVCRSPTCLAVLNTKIADIQACHTASIHDVLHDSRHVVVELLFLKMRPLTSRCHLPTTTVALLEVLWMVVREATLGNPPQDDVTAASCMPAAPGIAQAL